MQKRKQPLTVTEAGRLGGIAGGKKGGTTTYKRHGREHYQRIGRKGGQRLAALVALGKAKEQRGEK